MANEFSYSHVHFTGIKGVAMTAFALWCVERGMAVSGSDVEDEFPTQEALHSKKIPVSIGFDAGHIPEDTTCLVYTGAHGGRTNIEVKEAIRRGIPVFPHGVALGKAMNGKRGISVAGCHGKTTTSAFLAHVFSNLGTDPSYAIGCGMILPDMFPGASGSGDAFIAEADEYMTDPVSDKTPRFMWQHPELLVVTNIDYDHPDAYGSIEDVIDAFSAFAKQASIVIMNADDPNSRSLRDNPSVVTYGFSPTADVRITDIRFGVGSTFVDFSVDTMPVGTATLHIPGRHNAMNAAAVLAASRSYGLRIDTTIAALSQFRGTRRRAEYIGIADNELLVYDDYAHHPGEIEATLAGIRAWYPDRRIISVFQPHTFSRTKALLPHFARCFHDADIAVISDIYASARESDTLGMTAGILVESINAAGTTGMYGKSYDDVTTLLKRIGKKSDIIIFMGAGDIADWSRKFVKTTI